MSTVVIHHGDCRDVVRLCLEMESVDCIIADPPYGQTSLKWDRWPKGWPSDLMYRLKASGSMWCSAPFGCSSCTNRNSRAGACPKTWCGRSTTEPDSSTDRFRRVHESVAQFYLGRWGSVYRQPQYTNDAQRRVIRKKARPAHWTGATGATKYRSEDGGPRLMRSVMFHRNSHGHSLHPTQKPLALVESLLRYSCPPGGTVLDPFAGSGKTGVAAIRNRMNAILIESDPEHYATMEKRITLEQKQRRLV